MSQNRRDFIKFVIAGSVAAGCPVDHNLLAAAAPAHGTRKIVEGEHNEICHKVRDGFEFHIPPVSARKDAAVTGFIGNRHKPEPWNNRQFLRCCSRARKLYAYHRLALLACRAVPSWCSDRMHGRCCRSRPRPAPRRPQ